MVAVSAAGKDVVLIIVGDGPAAADQVVNDRLHDRRVALNVFDAYRLDRAVELVLPVVVLGLSD